MKKALKLFLTAAIFSAAFFAFAKKDLMISVEQLPQKAQTFIAQTFGGKTVSYTKMYTESGKQEYKVYFSNGDTIEFNDKGDWKEIECKNSEVPQSCVPPQAAKMIDQLFPNMKVLEIEIKSGKKTFMQVKLSNDIEIEFDADFNVIDID